jgi:LacI family transcriptional regulator
LQRSLPPLRHLSYNGKMKRSRITLRHVADHAGVHPSTVSRALNPETRSMLKPDLAARVVKAAAELGYRPHPIASSLRTNRTQTIGVVIPDLTNPLFPPIIRGIEDRLAAAGYTAIIANTDNDRARNRLTVERMRERRVDGLILATARRRDPLIAECSREDIPFLLINRTTDGDGVACIVNDDALGMRLVVDHIVALGHRRIAYVGGPSALSTGHMRSEGFDAAMRAAGIPVEPAFVIHADAFQEGAGLDAAHALLATALPFTAIVAANDLLALGCLDALKEVGLDCPRDVSITGFNDIPFLERAVPALTTVRIAHYHMGAQAADYILALARDEDVPVQKILLEPELVVRTSTAPPP